MGNIQNFGNVYAICSKNPVFGGGQTEDGKML